MKPTRIVKELYTLLVGRYYYKQIECDNGNTYTIKDLADLLGITQQHMAARLRHYGWQSEKIFVIEKLTKTAPKRIIKKPYMVTTKSGKK